MSRQLAEALVETLPTGVPNMFNPWKETCEFDATGNTPAEKIGRLAQHLSTDAKFVLVGEAPGYQGCRYSGVPFTSERLLIDGAIPRVSPTSRLSMRGRPFSEPSATIVWGALWNLGMESRTVLWNAVQLHPHKAGNVWSNRAPTPSELAYGQPTLLLLKEHFSSAIFVAVGEKAEAALINAGVKPAAKIRHPANGGATLFAKGLRSLVEMT